MAASMDSSGDPGARAIAVLTSSGETAYVQASALGSYRLQEYSEEDHPSTSSTSASSSSLPGASQADLSQVLSGLQTADLQAVLQQQPQLVQELTAIAAAGEASAEHLQFGYPVESAETVVSSGSSSVGGSGSGGKKKWKKVQTVYREQDRFLPIHNVSRIMRNAIPANGKVSKDAKECMQECVSEFISFITSESSDKCIQEKRKTITGDDILFAMATLGFDNYVEPLKIYLQKYREHTRTEKSTSSRPESYGDAESAAVTVADHQLTVAGYPAIAPQPL